MSQRDLAAELRGARIVAPDHVRAQVRLIAGAATRPPRRLTWRRALVVALPAAAAIAAVVVVTRPSSNPATPVVEREFAPATVQHGAATQLQDQATKRASVGAAAPAPSPTRAQSYGATLALQLPTQRAVSNGVKRALAITASLGGYPVSVHASSAAEGASAYLRLKVPRTHVAQAITRLSALGTIVGEQVDVQDAQAALNATDRTISRLQKQLRDLRAQAVQSDTVKLRIAALTARIGRLQRQEAATIRATRYATVQLQLATKPSATPKHHGHGPLHGLGVAFRWIGIGAVYGLALGGPLLVLIALGWFLVRVVRRRREDALLSRA